MSPGRLIGIVCTAQVLAQIGAYSLPALLPTIMQTWTLSNAQAGWIMGIFYAGYTLSVPVLVSLTDRIPPRRVYCCGVALIACSHLGFALLADGFWWAVVCRVLAGIGWAGTYMPGLKVLSDVIEGRTQSRAVAWHAASVGVSGALSFVVVGVVAVWLDDWRWSFGFGAGCAGAALLIAWLAMPQQQPRRPTTQAARALLDFRPVFRNRSAMAFAVSYSVHTTQPSPWRPGRSSSRYRAAA